MRACRFVVFTFECPVRSVVSDCDGGSHVAGDSAKSSNLVSSPFLASAAFWRARRGAGTSLTLPNDGLHRRRVMLPLTVYDGRYRRRFRAQSAFASTQNDGEISFLRGGLACIVVPWIRPTHAARGTFATLPREVS